mmetsp:Transcript_20700/g.57459  ORF Transcript_20700/g.57459 Transcript_20700/m.57459 type:complete len:355 (+) Transcript_20700:3151-4215(+)
MMRARRVCAIWYLCISERSALCSLLAMASITQATTGDVLEVPRLPAERRATAEGSMLCGTSLISLSGRSMLMCTPKSSNMRLSALPGSTAAATACCSMPRSVESEALGASPSPPPVVAVAGSGIVSREPSGTTKSDPPFFSHWPSAALRTNGRPAELCLRGPFRGISSRTQCRRWPSPATLVAPRGVCQAPPPASMDQSGSVRQPGGGGYQLPPGLFSHAQCTTVPSSLLEAGLNRWAAMQTTAVFCPLRLHPVRPTVTEISAPGSAHEVTDVGNSSPSAVAAAVPFSGSADWTHSARRFRTWVTALAEPFCVVPLASAVAVARGGPRRRPLLLLLRPADEHPGAICSWLQGSL